MPALGANTPVRQLEFHGIGLDVIGQVHRRSPGIQHAVGPGAVRFPVLEAPGVAGQVRRLYGIPVPEVRAHPALAPHGYNQVRLAVARVLDPFIQRVGRDDLPGTVANEGRIPDVHGIAAGIAVAEGSEILVELGHFYPAGVRAEIRVFNLALAGLDTTHFQVEFRLCNIAPARFLVEHVCLTKFVVHEQAVLGIGVTQRHAFYPGKFPLCAIAGVIAGVILRHSHDRTSYGKFCFVHGILQVDGTFRFAHERQPEQVRIRPEFARFRIEIRPIHTPLTAQRG